MNILASIPATGFLMIFGGLIGGFLVKKLHDALLTLVHAATAKIHGELANVHNAAVKSVLADAIKYVVSVMPDAPTDLQIAEICRVIHIVVPTAVLTDAQIKVVLLPAYVEFKAGLSQESGGIPQ